MVVKNATAKTAAERKASAASAPRMNMAPTGKTNPALVEASGSIDALAGAGRTRNEPYPISDAAETKDQVKVAKVKAPKPVKTVQVKLPRNITRQLPDAAIMHIHFGKDINGNRLSAENGPFRYGNLAKWWSMLYDGMPLSEFFSVDGGKLDPSDLKIWERMGYITVTKTTGGTAGIVPDGRQEEIRMSGTTDPNEEDAANEPDEEIEGTDEEEADEGEPKETTFPPTRRRGASDEDLPAA